MEFVVKHLKQNIEHVTSAMDSTEPIAPKSITRKHIAPTQQIDKPPETPTERRTRWQSTPPTQPPAKQKTASEKVATGLIFILVGVITVCLIQIHLLLPKKASVDAYIDAQQNQATSTVESPKPLSKTEEVTEALPVEETSNSKPKAEAVPEEKPHETDTDNKDSEEPVADDKTSEKTANKDNPDETKEETSLAIPGVTYPGVLIIGSAHIAQYADTLKEAFPEATVVADAKITSADIVSNIANTPQPTAIIIESGDNEKTGLWNQDVENMTTIYRNVPVYMITLDPKSPNASRTSDSINNLMAWHDWVHMIDFGATDMSAKTLVKEIQKVAPNVSV